MSADRLQHAPELTPAQARATYKHTGRVANGKPVFLVPTTKVLNLDSEFGHKLLCDGPTFTLGFACAFSCSFCYVENLLGRHSTIIRIMRETGLQFNQFVIEKEDPLPTLRRQLVTAQGKPRYTNPHDQRVVFASPLVDVAANLETARQTVEACKYILDHTHWQIRLLSKSALLRKVAEGLAEYRERVMYGLSTGTFNDGVARSFEHRTSSVSARLNALHWLQDEGYRTYGMVCPSLPQPNYVAFAEEVAAKLRLDRCEHVWAEVFNVRGKSLTKTCADLRAGGFHREAVRLETVSRDRSAWEEYARETFVALTSVVPSHKLRFMQYVQSGTSDWWRVRQHLGAVLLGKHAKSSAKAGTGGPPTGSTPISEPPQTLSDSNQPPSENAPKSNPEHADTSRSASAGTDPRRVVELLQRAAGVSRSAFEVAQAAKRLAEETADLLTKLTNPTEGHDGKPVAAVARTKKIPDPKRSEAAKRAWITIRKKQSGNEPR